MTSKRTGNEAASKNNRSSSNGDTALARQGLTFSDKDIALNALDIYMDKRIDWSDAFTASQMLQREITEIYSFDKHFDRIDGIARIDFS